MKLIFKSAVSASFELENTTPYVAPSPFDVYLNGQKVISNHKVNVFSLFSLKPETTYEVLVNQDKITFTTDKVSKVINVIEHGAKGDGITDDTKALQALINDAPQDALIQIPKGKYLVSPLFLKSDLTIHLEEGAFLLGDVNREKYPILEPTMTTEDGEVLELSTWEGERARTFASIITGIKVSNVKIVGLGVVDCQAHLSDWWI
ncbi:MAG TPA: glycosyl hydrolase family 28-related protein, partial [Acholeplasma sp.]